MEKYSVVHVPSSAEVCCLGYELAKHELLDVLMGKLSVYTCEIVWIGHCVSPNRNSYLNCCRHIGVWL